MNRWPHQHTGYDGECCLTESNPDDGATVLTIRQADQRVMISSSLLASIADHPVPHASVIPPDGFGGHGSLSLHTPVLTVTYRLDRLCLACDAWEASRA